MPGVAAFLAREPTHDELAAMPGQVLVEFGAPWCGHCIAAAPLAAEVLARRDEVRHLRVEDGRGRPLGRHFRVKLWPTFVLLRDGEERARVVRPATAAQLEALFDAATPAAGPPR